MRVEVNRVSGKRLLVETADTSIVVDALAEKGGPGDGVRSTELLLAALGACMTGTMLDFAANQEIPVEDVQVVLEDTEAGPPKRIGAITVTMVISGELTDRQFASLERVAAKCRIGNTLADSPEVSFEMRRA